MRKIKEFIQLLINFVQLLIKLLRFIQLLTVVWQKVIKLF